MRAKERPYYAWLKATNSMRVKAFNPDSGFRDIKTQTQPLTRPRLQAFANRGKIKNAIWDTSA